MGACSTRQCLRPTARGFAGEYDRLLSRYLRGQVATSANTGLITGVGLFLVGFPYALVLGVAVLGVVPYLGLVASLAPAVIIALASGEVGATGTACLPRRWSSLRVPTRAGCRCRTKSSRLFPVPIQPH